MDFQIKTGSIIKARSECLIVAVYADKTLSAAAQAVDAASGGAIKQLLTLKDLELKPGSSCWLTAPEVSAKRVLVMCLNTTKAEVSPQDITSAARKINKTLNGRNIKSAIWAAESVTGVSDQLFGLLLAQAMETSQYRYTTTRTQKVELPSLTSLTLQADTKLSAQWQKGLTIGKQFATGINTTRELGNLPGNICTPTYLAEQAKKLARGNTKLTTKVVEQAAMEKLGMGALLSVSAGSEQPPKLIAMEYKGGKANQAPIVLVGKGITFDTGGISLKPGAGMDEMKFDMCGAATVMGVMTALSLMQPAINVVGVIAAAENMPSGRATKPGDVVTSMSGQTIEILNTDAEGRLVLCDALTYVERYKPKAVIDIATLTGACVIALGGHASGLYSNHQPLADELLAAGQSSHDRAWQMPLWEDYQKSLNSNFADMANVGGREAGSVTAACFLARYTKAYHWAHLDIAGTAWLSGGAKGATGRPVGLLLQYLTNAFSA